MKLHLPKNKLLATVIVIFIVTLALVLLPLTIGLVIMWGLHKILPANRIKTALIGLVALATLPITGIWAAALSSPTHSDVKGATTQNIVTLTPTITPSFTPSPTKKPAVYTITTAPTVTPTITPQPTATTNGLSNENYYTNVDGNQVHSPADSTNGSVPAGATAQCADGTYSFSQHRSGTCSHHGGVAQWL